MKTAIILFILGLFVLAYYHGRYIGVLFVSSVLWMIIRVVALPVTIILILYWIFS